MNLYWLPALMPLLYISSSFEFKQISVIPDSVLANTYTKYLITFDRSVTNDNKPTAYNSQKVPSGSIIRIIFPIQYIQYGQLTFRGISSLKINNIPIYDFLFDFSTKRSIDIQSALPQAQYIKTIHIQLDGVFNPPFFKAKTSFFHGSIGSDKSVPIDNGIRFRIASITGEFSSRLYGSPTDLWINIDVVLEVFISSIIITVPNSFSIGTLACIYGSCIANDSNSLKANINMDSSRQILIVITGITTPKYVPTDYISVSYYSSNQNLIDINNNTIIFKAQCVLPCRTCQVKNSSACTSCYSDSTISSYRYLYQTKQCHEICPKGTFQSDEESKCYHCSSNCANCEGTSSNCTSCKQNSNQPYLFLISSIGICLNKCPSNYQPIIIQNITQCIECKDALCNYCQIGEYLFNKSCVRDCPEGITILNNIDRTCDICNEKCATCQNLPQNCTSCTNLFLSLNTCVPECSQGYLPIHGVCNPCAPTCKACSMEQTNCTLCQPGYLLFRNNCTTDCPNGYFFINNTNYCESFCPNGYFTYMDFCQKCAPSCILCSEASTCITCIDNYFLLDNNCLSSCPEGYLPNSTHCNIQHLTNNSSKTIVPVPFTIAGLVTGFLCLVSKFKYPETLVIAAFYSLWGLLQWGSIIVGVLVYYDSILQINGSDTEIYILLGITTLILLINILALITQTIFLRKSQIFQRWSRKKLNLIFYIFITILSLVTTHKLKIILFSNLFGRKIFSAKIVSIKLFTIFSILGIVVSMLTCCYISLLIYRYGVNKDQFLFSLIDIIILSLSCIIISMCYNIKKNNSKSTNQIQNTQSTENIEVLQNGEAEKKEQKRNQIFLVNVE